MRVAFHTLGCKLNQAETGALASRAEASGWDLVGLADSPDVVLINSCTVTAEAERECRQIIRRALRHTPDAYVIVTGCYAQLRPEEVASIDGVDLVLGSSEKDRAFALAGALEKRPTPRVEVGDVRAQTALGPGFTHDADSRVRAFLKVQDGCDYSCAFCTIPLARGPSRSHPLEMCVAEARRLVERGFRELVLTGVNVGDYGRRDGTSFLDLLVRLHDVEGLERLKISSIEPNLLTDAIIALVGESDRLLPHFHLPLQSGSDATLGRMRRRYRTELYAERCHRLAARVPDVALGADVIVGFPGETEEDVETTLALLESLPVAYLHVFTYSERAQTPAAEMDGVVGREERKRRSLALRQWSRRRWSAFGERQVGAVRPLLVEQGLEDGTLTGLTDNYLRLRFPGPEAWIGCVVDVRLTDWHGSSGAGEAANTPLETRRRPLRRTVLG
jgi:threonylcarbamoyladenosine tRNA methylthiotransferase MtaB